MVTPEQGPLIWNLNQSSLSWEPASRCAHLLLCVPTYFSCTYPHVPTCPAHTYLPKYECRRSQSLGQASRLYFTVSP